MSNFSTKHERSVNAVHDVRRRMQAVLLVVLGLAIAALANAADGTVERLMTQATAQPTLVLPTIPPSATANEPAAERIKLDLNTADAIAAIFDLVRFGNTEARDNASAAFAEAVKQEIVSLCDILGLIVENTGNDVDKALEEEIEKKIAERQACKKARDYAGADAIRDELAAKGIILEDTREGCKWHRA